MTIWTTSYLPWIPCSILAKLFTDGQLCAAWHCSRCSEYRNKKTLLLSSSFDTETATPLLNILTKNNFSSLTSLASVWIFWSLACLRCGRQTAQLLSFIAILTEAQRKNICPRPYCSSLRMFWNWMFGTICMFLSPSPQHNFFCSVDSCAAQKFSGVFLNLAQMSQHGVRNWT